MLKLVFCNKLVTAFFKFSMICSPGFTQVCPLDDIACPDDTEMICPHGAESQFMESLDRNGESGCQCIPDFLISHVKEKAEFRAGKNVASLLSSGLIIKKDILGSRYFQENKDKD